MTELEKVIITEMEKHHPKPVIDSEFWEQLIKTYGEFELNKTVMGLYNRGVIGFMPCHKKGSPTQLPTSPYKIVYRVMTLRKR